jgi:hypothetical protein
MSEEDEVCCYCGTTEDVFFGPDPFAEEIYGNDTDVWECADCRYESALAI